MKEMNSKNTTDIQHHINTRLNQVQVRLGWIREDCEDWENDEKLTFMITNIERDLNEVRDYVNSTRQHLDKPSDVGL